MRQRLAAVMAAVMLVGVFALPASAAIHCNSNGTPNLTSGRFWNRTTTATAYVRGDKKVGTTWTYTTVTVTGGQKAWENDGMCDSDFVKFNTAVTTADGVIRPSGTCFKITGGLTGQIWVGGAGQYVVNSVIAVVASSNCN